MMGHGSQTLQSYLDVVGYYSRAPQQGWNCRGGGRNSCSLPDSFEGFLGKAGVLWCECWWHLGEWVYIWEQTRLGRAMEQDFGREPGILMRAPWLSYSVKEAESCGFSIHERSGPNSVVLCPWKMDYKLCVAVLCLNDNYRMSTLLLYDVPYQGILLSCQCDVRYHGIPSKVIVKCGKCSLCVDNPLFLNIKTRYVRGFHKQWAGSCHIQEELGQKQFDTNT